MAENIYLSALNGMKEIFPDTDHPAESFTRKLYASAFLSYYEEKVPVYEAVETGYNNAVDKEQYLYNMAEAAVSAGSAVVDAVKKKSKRELKLIDLNLCIVVYVLPGILKYGGNCSEPLTQKILALWKEHYPKTNLMASTYEDIEAGFHKKFCYITTAVCETFGKPDDCYELELLRDYRDHYLQNRPDGEELIRRYYDVAPTIVKRINANPGRERIYRELWEDYLQPCIAMIEREDNESCCQLYVKMVEELQETYFYPAEQQS